MSKTLTRSVGAKGHSAWGEFNLIGRVRPRDGLITVSKEYVRLPSCSRLCLLLTHFQIEEDRGNWLYRGFLIGEANGNLAGRWRDTVTLPNQHGYEGCFFMGRRQ